MKARSGTPATPEQEEPDPEEFLPGTITDLNTQTRNASRVSVFIDGEFRFGCYKAVFLECGYRKDQTLSVSEYLRLMEAEQRFKLREYWLGLLSRRAHTATELRRKALRKGYPTDPFDELLEEFRQKDYIDEGAYARAYIRETHANKKWGASRIRQELKKRGVPERIVQHALEDELSDDQYEPMREIIQKNRRRFLRESDILKRKKKAFDHLVRKGYSPQLVLTHMKQLLAQLDNPDDEPDTGA